MIVTLSTAASTRLAVAASATWIRMRIVCPAKPLMSTEGVVNDAVSVVAATHQMSPTVNPSGNGSSGSRTYCARPVIQAVPLSVGTTAR